MNSSPNSLFKSPAGGRRRLCRGGVLSGLFSLWICLCATAAPETNAPARLDFSSFKLITDRNIFNTTRSPRRGGQGDDKPARVDMITLYGTFIYEKGPFAFFTGSSTEYKQVLDVGKTIAGYTIAAVDGRGVTLTTGTNTVRLRVGMQLRREEGGPWQVLGDSAPGGGGSSVTASDDSSSGEESDIIKRMMKQREEELK